MTNTERWLPVVGYEGLYEVSDLGRVRNSRTGRILAPARSGRYLGVKLSRDGKNVRYRIHRLVGRAFLGPLPPGMVTRHGPGRLHDNRLANLSYGTHRQNIHDQTRDGVHSHGNGQPGAKLTDAIVAECRIRHAAGESQGSLAREFGVTQNAMWMAIRGKTWRHVPGGLVARPIQRVSA
jgi:NUMOD4 motif/HNH endonuclease